MPLSSLIRFLVSFVSRGFFSLFHVRIFMLERVIEEMIVVSFERKIKFYYFRLYFRGGGNRQEKIKEKDLNFIVLF
jgi:hypothetical protein